ncbi:MAG: hypothetical protein EBZ62_00250 [Sphingobacteriia bacterium]|nr:hypothetical protein [Sphingobacteriia bacterium]
MEFKIIWQHLAIQAKHHMQLKLQTVPILQVGHTAHIPQQRTIMAQSRLTAQLVLELFLVLLLFVQL